MTMTAEQAQSDIVEISQPQDGSIGSRSRLVRLYSSAVVATFLLAAFGTILPDSQTATAVDRVTAPVAKYTGFHQQWGLFSPNPSSIEYGMHAEIVFADGDTAIWKPESPSNWDSVRKERWRKWVARVGDEQSEHQWAGTAWFIAQEYEAREVVLVRLINTWSTVPEPEEPPQPRDHSELTFYEWNPITQTGEVLDAWE